MKRGSLMSLAFLAVAGLVLFGCSPKPTPKMGFFLDINKDSLDQVDKDGIRISVKPITLENYSTFPRVSTNMPFQTPTGPKTYPWVDLNLPAFELTVLNDTGHVLRFSRAVIKLQDDLGNSYDASMKSDLEDMVDAYAVKLREQMLTFDIVTAKGRIKAVKLLDQNTELLPGITEKVYVTFNYPQEAAAFLAGKSYLKLMLYEVPVETNEAGDVSKTTNFEFLYDVHAKTVGVTG